jgi:hypothetical protein
VPPTEDDVSPRWFGVRCLFRHGERLYEERITLWRALGFDEAIALAEADAAEYSADLADGDLPTEYVGLAQAYRLDDEPGTVGAEVFSLIRDSDLPPGAYIDRFFDTGDEHSR